MTIIILIVVHQTQYNIYRNPTVHWVREVHRKDETSTCDNECSSSAVLR